MADSHLQITGGGGGGDGHPDPEIRGGPASKKIFSVLRASFWSKNKGGPAPPGPSPGFCSRTSTNGHVSTTATFFGGQSTHWLLFKPVYNGHFLLSPRWPLRGINCTRTKVSYPSCNLLCIWYISELFLQLIKSTPEVSSLAINFIWVHCSPRSLHPLPKCRTQFKRWPESTFSYQHRYLIKLRSHENIGNDHQADYFTNSSFNVFSRKLLYEGVKLFHLLVFGLEFHSRFVKFQVRIQGVDQLLTLRIWCHIPFKSFFFLVKSKNLKKTSMWWTKQLNNDLRKLKQNCFFYVKVTLRFKVRNDGVKSIKPCLLLTLASDSELALSWGTAGSLACLQMIGTLQAA